ncbi:MAG TPA: hypothetical protein VLL76_10635, partial [Candidatus Omnitrophota bacterium]|nr:hypothetical protein [Candidatus Omnitrophota bacterium]
MAKALAQVHSFTSGKLDRLLAGRRDLKAFYSGALEMRNVVPLQLGGFSTRPGLRRVAEIPEAAAGARLARFEQSTEAVYLLVLLHQAVKVFHEDVVVATPPAPWTAAQLPDLDWTQSLDTMILVHPDLEYRKLVRQGNHATWAFSTLALTNIPTHKFDGST